MNTMENMKNIMKNAIIINDLFYIDNCGIFINLFIAFLINKLIK